MALVALTQGLLSLSAFAQSSSQLQSSPTQGVTPTTPAQTGAATAPTGSDAATATSGSGAENIVVTGSRLRTSNATSESPVVVVTSAQIQHSSAQTIEDVLTRLPEIGTSGVYATTNNGGDGSSCIDIRNLGVERTLVLVDGKRFVQSAGGITCVDLNNIPLDLVDRIEVLKDGASTTYGADAVAGVVNIILKHNFSGVVFHANGGIATDAGDDKQGEISATAGTTFDHGNFTVSAEYLNRGPVAQADRDWAQNPLQGDVKGTINQRGSFYNPNGTILTDTNNINPATAAINNANGNFDGSLLNKSGTAISPNVAPDNPNNFQGYNFGADQVLQGSLEKESLTSTANYDFNENITGYMEEFYTHKITGQQLAPQPISGGLSPAILPDAYVIPEGNPYLTALLGPGSGPVDLYKRETQFGDRQYRQYTDTFQFNGGFKGTVGAGWDYEVFFQYGQSDNRLEVFNSINFQRLEQETGFQQTTPTAADIAAGAGGDPTTFGVYNPGVCLASTGCVLSNPFGQNLSAAAINYAKFTEVDTATNTLKIYGGEISNSNLYQLPYGPLGISLGVEHRTETGEFTPDNLLQTGVTAQSPVQPTAGSFNVTELYGEVRVPVLKDLPFAKDLHVDLGGRFFNYNTFGSGETWKVSGNYTPVNGLRFRGSDGVAFRQPSITDLFEGTAIGFNPAQDPCSNARFTTYTAAQQANVRANCAKQGINVDTFTQVGSQIQTVIGGNPNLNPETARTQTLGIVATPPFVPRLAITLDYYRTKIDNTISSVPTPSIVDGCYTSANLSSPLCALVNPRLGTGQLSTVVGTNENLGETRTEGLDVGTTYSYPIPNYGTISFQNDLTYVFKYDYQNLPNGPFIGANGTIQLGISTPGYPRLRDNASVDWRIGDFQFGYRMRFIQGMAFFDSAPLDPATSASSRTPSIFYHDIIGSYDYKNFSFNLGVDNLFDKAPPYVFDGATNTDPAVYDVLGRVVYLKTTLRF